MFLNEYITGIWLSEFYPINFLNLSIKFNTNVLVISKGEYLKNPEDYQLVMYKIDKKEPLYPIHIVLAVCKKFSKTSIFIDRKWPIPAALSLAPFSVISY